MQMFWCRQFNSQTASQDNYLVQSGDDPSVFTVGVASAGILYAILGPRI